MLRWVQWMSVKHNDGRRSSGVGKNVSRLHLENGNSLLVLCGREIQIRIDGRLPLHRANMSKHPGECSRCLAAAKNRDLIVPPVPGRKEREL